MIIRDARPEDGAAIVFEGVVRNHTRGRGTLYLDYEAYEEMALKQMEELAAQALAQFQVRDVSIIHRLGRLEIEKTLHYIVTFGVALNAITVHKSVSWSVTHHSGRRDAALPCIVRSRTNIAFRLMGCRRNMDVWNRRFLVSTLPLDAFPRRS